MRILSLKNTIFTAGIAVILLSCNTSSHFSRETVKTDGLFGDAAQTDSATIANTPWQQLFTDPQLQNLIREGLDNNPDLQIAIQRVVEAEAYYSQGKASLFPSVTAQAGGGYVRNPETLYPDGPRNVKDFQLNFQASWEVDIWGKLRSAKRSAYANLLASDAGRKAVQTELISGIANTYYSLLALDEQLAITRETVKNNIDLVETMKILKNSGQVTGAAVVQTEAIRYAAEVTIPDLEQTIRETENTLCLLLGRTPGKIERGSLADQKSPELIKTGVPAQLLDNRPDVMQAEYAVMSAYELTDNARAYFYPALTITALSGFESPELDKLLDPIAFSANVIGGLTAPLLNKRTNVTRLEVAKARQEEALISFRNTLLNAGMEVNNALGQYDASEKKTVLRRQQLNSLEKSLSYTKELLNYGSATYTEVLNAQQSLLSAQLNDVNDHLQKLTSVVFLYRALGGGWKQ
ncbi:MAG: efflux transporter outer membrane subunit [Mangrovibacterium sp.]